MRRVEALVPMMVLAVVLAGCGGGGSGLDLDSPQVEAQQQFLIDFANDTVEVIVQPALVERNPGDLKAEIRVNLWLALQDPGTPGRRQLNAQVTNHSSGLIGRRRGGAVTGLDLLLVFTEFRDGANHPLGGGGYGGYDAVNSATGTPVYHLDEALPVGATSSVKQIDMVLPPGAVKALITLVVRADTERLAPPARNRTYVTTLLGRRGHTGCVDGPPGLARLNISYGVVVREDVGDILFTDFTNHRLRRFYNNYISNFAGTGNTADLYHPVDLDRDPAGNIVVSEWQGYCVSLIAPSGGTATVIAGQRGTPGYTLGSGDAARFRELEGLGVAGDAIYVSDFGNAKIHKIQYQGYGDRFDPTSYAVTDWAAAGQPAYLYDVAFDALGNAYATDFTGDQIGIIPADSGHFHVIAGTGTAGHADGRGDVATLTHPALIDLDQSGLVYFTEGETGAVRCLRHTGGGLTHPTNWVVETILPNGGIPPVEGINGDTNWPVGMDVASDGTIFYVDYNCLRRIDRARS